MNRSVCHILLAGLMICCPTFAGAQDGFSRKDEFRTLPVAFYNDYEALMFSNPWNRGMNVNGIRKAEVSAAYAELTGFYGRNSLRSTYGAPEEWNVGAVSAGTKTLEKISLTGSFSFNHAMGYDMCGSMMLHPGYYPVDVMEFTPGMKKKQTYRVNGGIASDISRRWRIGVSGDFESVNYAKMKDLRYSDYGLDFSVTPSFLYDAGDFSFGMSYRFRKTSEAIGAQEIGMSGLTFFAFLDKGDRLGTYQAWDGSGVHLKDAGINGFPIRESSHHVAAQVQYRDFYAEVVYRHAFGKVGEKDYTWFDFPTDGMSLDLAWTHRTAAGTGHDLALRFDWLYQKNAEHVLDRQNEGGVITVHDLGRNPVYSRECFRLHPVYRLTKGIFTFGAELVLDWQSSLNNQIYPYVSSRDVFVGNVIFSARWNLPEGFNIDFAAGGHGGRNRDDLTASRPESLAFMEEQYLQDVEAQLVPAACATVGFGYDIWKGMRIGLRASWQGLLAHPEHVPGRDNVNLLLVFGYDF